jgi:hypothetical protein
MIPGGGLPGRHVVTQISDALAGNASGATLTVTTSLPTVGAATGGAAAAGATLTVTTSLIAGAATSSALIAGPVLTTTLSLPTSGAATGDALANGATITATESLIGGTASGGALALGTLLTLTAALLEGVATVDVSTNGDTITVTVTLLEGIATGGATGDANAAGATITIDATLAAGAADSGEKPISGRVAGVGPGFYKRKPEPRDVIAFGATIEVPVSIVSGVAAGEVRTERVRETPIDRTPSLYQVPVVEIVPADVTVNARTAAQVLELKALLVSGVARCDWTEYDNALLYEEA